MSFSFSHHVALLSQFLDRRHAIFDAIEHTLLNVQGKETSRNRNRDYFERLLNACFFNVPGLPRDLSGLKGQLAATHLADGFEPLRVDNYSCELDPLELTVRAYQYWEHHRWPGKSGRLACAQIIYAVFMLRQLEHLSLRIWDAGNDHAAAGLQDVQRLLDRLNEPAIATLFVRDARWLIHTAQGPLTRHLRPYFTIAAQISGSFSESDRRELHKAGAKLAGGHLRSQRRYRMWETHLPSDHPEILAVTRHSNSMDNALLVRDLVPLLDAYKRACAEHDQEGRLDLADAILQGMSADPELFLTRLDLLGPCTMIEHLFIDRGEDGRARMTLMGDEHLGLLAHYGDLVGQLAAALREDASVFDPAQLVYSPYGITYGFSADLLSNMAQRGMVSQSAPLSRLSFEDTFVSRGGLDDKLTRAKDWEALPIREGERQHFEHSAEWAGHTFGMLTRAIEARALHPHEPNASEVPNRRLFVAPETSVAESVPEGVRPPGIVSAQDLRPKFQILTDRNEGRFLASAESDGKWFTVSKVLLTEFTSQGQDALMTGVPAPVIEILGLTCPGLVTVMRPRS
jgi:hypothetical protein